MLGWVRFDDATQAYKYGVSLSRRPVTSPVIHRTGQTLTMTSDCYGGAKNDTREAVLTE